MLEWVNNLMGNYYSILKKNDSKTPKRHKKCWWLLKTATKYSNQEMIIVSYLPSVGNM